MAVRSVHLREKGDGEVPMRTTSTVPERGLFPCLGPSDLSAIRYTAITPARKRDIYSHISPFLPRPLYLHTQPLLSFFFRPFVQILSLFFEHADGR